MPVQAAQKTAIQDINKLEADFKITSSSFYSDFAGKNAGKTQIEPNVDQLLININKLVLADEPVKAIQLIYFNRKTVDDNLDTKAVVSIIELLLHNNEWNFANRLYQDLLDEGDDSLAAPVHFLFAKYYAERNQWKQVIKLLNGIYSELSEENTAYAYLLNGSALQHLKKHRQAVASYNKIPKTSEYYSYAQLNTAIANIRQGWWTDAQSKIKNLLKLTNKTNKDEMTNRLYLIMGYALLQRELFRDARAAFRHISLDSRYTNRALLGVGLTATSQGDYIGGLNALTILKDKKTYDLSVDESYLLIPYVYEKLQQEMTVSTSYTEAMNYYQRRINSLKKIAKKHNDFSKLVFNDGTLSLIIENNSFDYGRSFPESFLTNYKQLRKFETLAKNVKIKNRISKLISKYDDVYQKVISQLANQRIEYIKSYLNQSRYGLARLYDSSKELNN